MASFIPPLPPPPVQHRLPSLSNTSPNPNTSPPSLPLPNHPLVHQQQHQITSHQSPHLVNGHHSNMSIPPLKTFGELEAKYNRLKRKYFEMEGRMKEERREKEEINVSLLRMKTERRAMLDRIAELEAAHNTGNLNILGTSAFPALLTPLELPPASIAHLKQTLEADDRDDTFDEPKRRSRHHLSGAQRPLKQEDPDLVKEKEKERDARHSNARFPLSASSPSTSTNVAQSSASAGKKRGSRSGGGRKPDTSVDGGMHHQPSTTVVSTGGTRLRIRPPNPTESYSSRAHSPQEKQEMGPPSLPADPASLADNLSPISPVPLNPIPAPSSSAKANGSSPSQLNTRIVPNPKASAIQRSTKPKRLKAHTVTAKTYSVPMIPRDPRTNKPILPLSVGIMTVINLGEVCMREHFHTERYIFPVGYEVTRRYLSTVSPTSEVTYHCQILEGSSGPIFQIKAPDIEVIEAGTATGAWSGIVKAANGIRNRQHSNSVSGPDYFGLGQNTIKHLIQGLSGANNLRDYVWQNYLEGGPMGGRHAAVMPALPEDTIDLPPSRYHPSDSMDVDGEDHESVLEATESASGSPALQDSEDVVMSTNSHTPTPSTSLKTSVPVVNTASNPESLENQIRSLSASSPQTRSIPSSMASILNSYPPEEEESESRIDARNASNGAVGGSRTSSSPRTQAMARPSSSSSTSPTLLPPRLASVARDSAGRPILPLEIPPATLLNLGEITARDGYHTTRCIYPIGYELERRWMSAVHPTADVNYNCKILEGSKGPLFQVTAQDQPERSIRRENASDAWAVFSREAKAIRHQQPLSMDQGDEYFGLTNNTIRCLIQELAGAKDLKKYEWRNFEGK